MRISVVTPACNAAPFLADAIGSVLAQTHADLRHVVVDDGSTDDTAAIAARFDDPRLTLIRQPNAGVSAARNRGWAEARGDALLFLDADDVLAPTALATLAAALCAAPGAVASVGRVAVESVSWPAASPAASVSWPGLARQPTSLLAHRRVLRELLPRLLVQNRFANCGHVLIRGDAAHRAGPFRPGIVFGEDWEFLIRLALLGRFACTPTPVLLVRSRPDGAYRRFAADPDRFVPCMDAIFGNPDLLQRFGAARLAALRRHADAENQWIVGRELIRQGRVPDGMHHLRCSLAAAPSAKRIALLGLAHLLPLLPPRWRGPFRNYATYASCDRNAAVAPINGAQNFTDHS